jgi:hypothetical protein
MLPLGGDVAYRLNLFSAAGAALAAGLCAVAIIRLGQQCGAGARVGVLPLVAGALTGGLALALAPLTWSQATITEVYAPGLAALSLLSLLVLGWRTNTLKRGAFLLGGVIGGLGLGLLPQLALVTPGWLALMVADRPGLFLLARRLGLALAGAAGGLSVYAYLPLRAAEQPLVNWGDPTSPARFWAVIGGAQYRYLFTTLSPTNWLDRLVDSLGQLGHNLGWIVLALAVLGGLQLWRGQRAALGYLLSLVILTVLFRTSYPAEGNVVYLLPALYALSLLAGLGAARALTLVQENAGRSGAVSLAVGLLGLGVLRAAAVAPQVDASWDRSAELFAARVLDGLPPDAVVVSERDETTFSLWYRQALGERNDVVVVDSRLLFRDWYQGNLARRYPDLNPAAVRPGGLTALERPVYLLVGPPGEEVAQRHGSRPAVSLPRSRGNLSIQAGTKH